MDVRTLLVFALIAANGCLAQNPLVSNALGSNMVLQQAPQQALIWGWTQKPNVKIAVVFNGETYTTNSSKTDSSWSISLPETEAGGPYSINIKSSEGETASLDNILFGDVWLCGGQSNMVFSVSQAFNATTEVADAANYPNIRVFTVGQASISQTPVNNFESVEQIWSVGSSTSVGNPAPWTYMSAVCWFYGVELYNRYKVPIGLVSSNWGGTIIQAWSSPEALKKCNSTEEFDSEEEYTEAFGIEERQANPNQPSVLWNAMIVPLLPMRIRGAIWYQAEQNVGQSEYYACAFPAMITDWRASFGYLNAEDFPFFFVQLAPYTEGNNVYPSLNLPNMRLAQTAALALSSVGMATAIDVGDPLSSYGNIHPRNKQVVGKRLALASRAMAYGDQIQYTGPTFASFTGSQTDGVVQAVITFEESSIGSGLVLRHAYCPELIGEENCGWAEIQTSDGVWLNATISLSDDNVIFEASVTTTVTVTGVSYLYNNWPVATIYNEEGLPATPFFSVVSKRKMTLN